jgi:hypothetical protein
MVENYLYLLFIKKKEKKKQTAGQKVDPCRLGEPITKKKHINYPHYIFVHMDVYKLFIKFGNAKRLRIFNFKKIQYDTLLSSKYIYFCSHGSVPLFSLSFFMVSALIMNRHCVFNST